MSEPDNNARAPSQSGGQLRSSGPRSVAETLLAPATAHPPIPLKIVTIAPPTEQGSIPDVEASSVAPMPTSRPDPYIGCTIDERYKVEAVLGEGGMGVVYRCRHKVIGKKVAMKVLRADLARDSELTERFLNEARSASAIGNAHIIDISDFGQLPDGSTYFVMEFLEGTPLTASVEGGQPVPVQRILNIAHQLAEALSAAHEAGIVHRDLKPDNIFLINRGTEKDFVKILDFGIAKVSTSADGRLTRAGAVFGTPHYMSPEQAAGAPVDHRGDIYSFGVILYELASGRVPFDADNFMGILTQHMYKSPVPIRALVPQPQEVPPGLEAIVLKCLSKRAEHRYQSMGELLGEIDKLRQGLVPDAVPEMMARSGGFNVPADYFKKGGMPVVVPASPGGAPRSRWGIYAGIAGVCAAIGIVGAIFAKSRLGDAAAPLVTTHAAGKAEAAGDPLVTPTSPDDMKVMRQVVLAIDPLDAHVFRGDRDLGASPVLLDVEDGVKTHVEIRRTGYVSQALDLDASEPRRSIKLERLASGAARGGARPKAAAKTPPPEDPKAKPKGKVRSSIGGSEIVDPWSQ
jgi:serine/threonine-protein kinase